MNSTVRSISVALAALLLSANAANSEAPGHAILADTCAICHGPGGESPGSVPSLNSLSVEEIRNLLLAMREGEVEVTLMDRFARAFTDAEIEALAHHFGMAEE